MQETFVFSRHRPLKMNLYSHYGLQWLRSIPNGRKTSRRRSRSSDYAELVHSSRACFAEDGKEITDLQRTCTVVSRYTGRQRNNHCTPFFTNLSKLLNIVGSFVSVLVNRYTRTEPMCTAIILPSKRFLCKWFEPGSISSSYSVIVRFWKELLLVTDVSTTWAKQT